LQMRARGFALRDAFPDVLKGLLSAEEAGDIPWEDTGLSMAPPVAHGIKLPSEATQQMMRPAAAATPRAPRVVATTAYDAAWLAPLDEPDGMVWLGNLERVLAACTSQDEVTEAGGHVSVRNAVAKAPPDVRRRVSELLAQHFARLAPDPAQPSDGQAGEVTIEGEKYAAA